MDQLGLAFWPELGLDQFESIKNAGINGTGTRFISIKIVKIRQNLDKDQ